MSHPFELFYYEQQDDYSCGPSCIKMAADFLGKNYPNFNQLMEWCNCDEEIGSTDVGMKNALEKTGLSAIQNTVATTSETVAIQYLDEILKAQNFFIMRTLTKDEKHWILVYGKSANRYLVADPWLGLIKYDHEEIINIWKPRAFDGFCVMTGA